MSCQHRILDHNVIRFSLLFAIEISLCHSVDFLSWKLDPGSCRLPLALPGHVFGVEYPVPEQVFERVSKVLCSTTL